MVKGVCATTYISGGLRFESRSLKVGLKWCGGAIGNRPGCENESGVRGCLAG